MSTVTPESRTKKAISTLLKSYGEALYYEMPVPSGFGKSGLDYGGCVGGRAFFIEAKAPGAKPTARQAETIRRQEAAGARVFVIDAPDSPVLSKLKEWIDSCK